MFLYYVYAYMSNGLPYYIGKGKGYRAFNKQHNVPVPTDKTDIIFLEKNLSNVGACAIERRMISWYGRLDIGTGILLNKTDGGEVGSVGYKLSEEQKEKISVANKGKPTHMLGKTHSAETIKKMRDIKIGKVVSLETRKKISDKKQGKLGITHSEESKAKISDTKKGTICSEETRKKIGSANKGKSPSIEARKKMSESHKGKPSKLKGRSLSDETRKKMSEAQKNRQLKTRGFLP